MASKKEGSGATKEDKRVQISQSDLVIDIKDVNALSFTMATLSTIDLNNLTEAERDLILSVIRRDEELREKYQERINKLRAEIKEIRLNAVIRDGDEDPSKWCPRCRTQFGWFFNRGDECPQCVKKVCSECQQAVAEADKAWICILCLKQRQLTEMSGEWFYTKFRKSKRHRKTNRPILGSEIVKTSMKRKARPQNGGSVNLVNEEVKRRVWANADSGAETHDGELSDTQSAGESSTPRSPRSSKGYFSEAAFPKESDKLMLMDLLGGKPSSRPAPTHPPSETIVRRVVNRRVSDSSSDDDHTGGDSSPPMSHRTESEFNPSDSMRSSLRSNSAISSDGRITVVTETASVISGISTAPPSMFEAPGVCVANGGGGDASPRHSSELMSKHKSSPDSAIDNPSYSSRSRQESNSTTNGASSSLKGARSSQFDDEINSSPDRYLTTRGLTTALVHAHQHQPPSPMSDRQSAVSTVSFDSRSTGSPAQQYREIPPDGPEDSGGGGRGISGVGTNGQTATSMQRISPQHHGEALVAESATVVHAAAKASSGGTVKNSADRTKTSNETVTEQWVAAEPTRDVTDIDNLELSSIHDTTDDEVMPKGSLGVGKHPSSAESISSSDSAGKSSQVYISPGTAGSVARISHTQASNNFQASANNVFTYDSLEFDLQSIEMRPKTGSDASDLLSDIVEYSEPPSEAEENLVKYVTDESTEDEISRAHSEPLLYTQTSEDEETLTIEIISANQEIDRAMATGVTNQDLAHTKAKRDKVAKLSANQERPIVLVSTITSSKDKAQEMETEMKSANQEPQVVLSTNVEPINAKRQEITGTVAKAANQQQPVVLATNAVPIKVKQEEIPKAEIKSTEAANQREVDGSDDSVVHINAKRRDTLTVLAQMQGEALAGAAKWQDDGRRDSLAELVLQQGAKDGQIDADDDIAEELKSNQEMLNTSDFDDVMRKFAEIDSDISDLQKSEKATNPETNRVEPNGEERPLGREALIACEVDKIHTKHETIATPQDTEATRHETEASRNFATPVSELGKEPAVVGLENDRRVNTKQDMLSNPVQDHSGSPPIIEGEERSANLEMQRRVDAVPKGSELGVDSGVVDREYNLERELAYVAAVEEYCEELVEGIAAKAVLEAQAAQAEQQEASSDRNNNDVTLFGQALSPISGGSSAEASHSKADDSVSSSLRGSFSSSPTSSPLIGARTAPSDTSLVNPSYHTAPNQENISPYDSLEILVDDSHEFNEIRDSGLSSFLSSQSLTSASAATPSLDPVPALQKPSTSPRHAVVSGSIVHPAFSSHANKKSLSPNLSSASQSHPTSTTPQPTQSDTGPLSSTPTLLQRVRAEGGSPVSQRTSSSIPSIAVTTEDHTAKKREADEELDRLDEMVTVHLQQRHKERDFSQSQPNLAPPKSNLLNPSLSASMESMTSIYSSAGEANRGRIVVTGGIQFGLEYNYKQATFLVHIKTCKELAVADVKKKRTDPYVKTYLLPDRTKSGKKKTGIRKNNRNPTFEETIKYHISMSELVSRTLWVTVWHNDRFGRNDFLGEVTVPLDYYKFEDTTPKWYKLQPRNQTPIPSLLTYKGDLDISLKFVTAEHASSSRKGHRGQGGDGNNGELQVVVKQARNLTAVRSNGSSDPFCKAILHPDHGKQSKKKTGVIKNNCSPQWNYTFVFENLSFENLKDICLELSIWDHDRFTSNDFLGGVRLGLGTGKSYGKDVEWNDSKGEEVALWQSMIDRPNQLIDGTLLLRTTLDSRRK